MGRGTARGARARAHRRDRAAARPAVGDGAPHSDRRRGRLVQGEHARPRARGPARGAPRPEATRLHPAPARARSRERLDADGRCRRAAARSRRGRAQPDALARRPAAVRRRPGRPHRRRGHARRARASPTSGWRRSPPRRRICWTRSRSSIGNAREARRRAARDPGAAATSSASFGVPATIQHDDLHDGQVFVRDGRLPAARLGRCVRLASVLHTGRHARRRHRLGRRRRRAFRADGAVSATPTCGPLPRVHGEEDLVAACTIARRLGWVCRAVNGYLAPFETEQTGRRLRMFLDGSP